MVLLVLQPVVSLLVTHLHKCRRHPTLHRPLLRLLKQLDLQRLRDKSKWRDNLRAQELLDHLVDLAGLEDQVDHHLAAVEVAHVDLRVAHLRRL